MNMDLKELTIKEQEAYNAYMLLFDRVLNDYLKDKDNVPDCVLEKFIVNSNKINQLREIIEKIMENEIKKVGDK